MHGNGVVGILREEQSKWERRAALTPAHCNKILKENGVVKKIIVQPCGRRIYPDWLYKEAGCEVSEDLSPCGLILGVKRPNLGSFLSHRSYAIFSHCHKGQEHAIPLLQELLQKRNTLFDYELMVGADGKRTVAFGEYAGRAGMVDFLRGLGERFLSLGFSTPFLGLAFSHMYPSLSKAMQAVAEVGEEIKKDGLPAELCPLVFVFTGSGNVGKGAMEMCKLLPHTFVSCEQLPGLVEDKAALQSRFQLYACVVDASHMVQHIDPGHAAFDKAHYYAHPDEYRPVFHLNVAPYASVIVNCLYWEPRFPRLLTNDQLRDLVLSKQSHLPLLGVADITCDINGSIECINRLTSLDQPFLRYDPLTASHYPDLDGEGLLLMAVDVLPTEFPRQATDHFGDAIQPLLQAMACDLRVEHMAEPVQKACIVYKGQLTKPFDHLINQHASQAPTEYGKQICVPQSSNLVSATVHLSGNIFDPFLINEMLDIIVENDGDFQLEALDSGIQQQMQHSRASSFCAKIKISTDDEPNLSRIRNLLTNHIDPAHEFLKWSS